jgi:hypothetical protein
VIAPSALRRPRPGQRSAPAAARRCVNTPCLGLEGAAEPRCLGPPLVGSRAVPRRMPAMPCHASEAPCRPSPAGCRCCSGRARCPARRRRIRGSCADGAPYPHRASRLQRQTPRAAAPACPIPLPPRPRRPPRSSGNHRARGPPLPGARPSPRRQRPACWPRSRRSTTREPPPWPWGARRQQHHHHPPPPPPPAALLPPGAPAQHLHQREPGQPARRRCAAHEPARGSAGSLARLTLAPWPSGAGTPSSRAPSSGACRRS